jgi:phosphatidylglycerophosphatase A
MSDFPNLKNPVHLFATIFGIGLLPIAPGTWGSLFALVLFLIFHLLIEINSFYFFVSVIIISLFSILICWISVRDQDVKDPGSIVLDEFAGIWLAFFSLVLSEGLFFEKNSIKFSILSSLFIFFAFRFFDIKKPFPINTIDKEIKNGFGVVLDDLVAGVYTSFLYLFLCFFFYRILMS